MGASIASVEVIEKFMSMRFWHLKTTRLLIVTICPLDNQTKNDMATMSGHSSSWRTWRALQLTQTFHMNGKKCNVLYTSFNSGNSKPQLRSYPYYNKMLKLLR